MRFRGHEDHTVNFERGNSEIGTCHIKNRSAEQTAIINNHSYGAQ